MVPDPAYSSKRKGKEKGKEFNLNSLQLSLFLTVKDVEPERSHQTRKTRRQAQDSEYYAQEPESYEGEAGPSKRYYLRARHNSTGRVFK
jgi:hypothetical protein